MLPVTAYSIMQWYNTFYNRLPVLGKINESNIGVLVTQYNQPFHHYQLSGNIAVVNFFFTSCPVICVRMMNNVKKVQKAYTDDLRVRFLSVTVDPVRDVPERLQDYIRKMKIDDHSWQLLTGEKRVIYSIARNDFKLVAAAADNEEEDFIHSDKLVLLDKKGQIRGYYNGTDQNEIEKLINDINKLKHEPPDFNAR